MLAQDCGIDKNALKEAKVISAHVLDQIQPPVPSTQTTENTRRFDGWYGAIIGALLDDGAQASTCEVFSWSIRNYCSSAAVMASKTELIDVALRLYADHVKEVHGAKVWSIDSVLALSSLDDFDECWGLYRMSGLHQGAGAGVIDVSGYDGQSAVALETRIKDHLKTLGKGHEAVKAKREGNHRVLAVYVELTKPGIDKYFGTIAKAKPIDESCWARYHLRHLLTLMETAQMIFDGTLYGKEIQGGLKGRDVYRKYRPIDMPRPIYSDGFNFALPVTQGVRPEGPSKKDRKIVATIIDKIGVAPFNDNRKVAPLYREHAVPLGIDMSAYDFLR